MSREEENNGFGPITRPRSKFTHRAFDFTIVASFLIVAAIIIYRLQSEEHARHLFQVSSISIAGALVGQFVRRCGLLVEEYQHLHTRYKGSLRRAFSACFVPYLSGLFLGLSSITCLLAIAMMKSISSVDVPYLIISFGVSAFLVPMVLDFFSFHYPTRCEKSFIDESEKKSMADGFAWALYYGFLKRILPRFRDRVAESSDFRRKLALEKILIPIPHDCYIPQSFDENERIKKVGTLAESPWQHEGFSTKINHNVYMIEKPDGRQVYFVAEFPAIVHRFLQISEHADAGLSQEDKDEQIAMFYHSLNNVLENHAPECKGNYCLVPYAGRESDLAEVILRAIENETTGVPTRL